MGGRVIKVINARYGSLYAGPYTAQDPLSGLSGTDFDRLMLSQKASCLCYDELLMRMTQRAFLSCYPLALNQGGDVRIMLSANTCFLDCSIVD